MNKIELNYPNWDRYNKDIVGLVLVAKNTVLPPDDPAYTDPINRGLSADQIGKIYVKGYAGFENLYPYLSGGKSFWNSLTGSVRTNLDVIEALASSTGTIRYFRNCIIGKCTGRYRVVDGFTLVEVDLYLHSWQKSTGMVIKKLEILLQGFTDNTVEFITEVEAIDRKLNLSFDYGWRNMIRLGSTFGNYTYDSLPVDVLRADKLPKSIDPDYFKYSKVDELLIKFGGRLTNEALGDKSITLDELYMLYIKGSMDSEIIYRDAKSIGVPYSSWIKIQPLWSWVGGVPIKTRVLAHKTNPVPTLGGTDVLESVLFENYSWKDRPFGYIEPIGYPDNENESSYVAVKGLEAGENYYFRTYIQYSPIAEDGQSFDLDTTNEWYSDSARLAAFSGFNDPILYFGAKWPIYRGTDYLKFRLGFVQGDRPISRLGVVYCKNELGRAPNLDLDPFVEVASINSTMEILISGLEEGTPYWFKTFIVLTDNTILYPTIEKSGYEYRGPGYILWYGDCVAYTRDNSATVGEIVIKDTFRLGDTGMYISLQVLSDGGSDIIEAGICYSTVPMPTIANSKKEAEFSRGPYVQTYVDLQDLNKSTKYYLRPYATSFVGTWYGPQKEVTTLEGPIRSPKVTTITPDNITFNSADLKLEVTDNIKVTEKGFVWKAGLVTPTLSDNVILESNTDMGIFSSHVTGLNPKTLYSYRSYIKAPDYIWGDIVRFTTLDITDSSIITNINPKISLGNIPEKIYSELLTSVIIQETGSYPITDIGIILSKTPIVTTNSPDTYTLKYQIGNSSTIGTYPIKITIGLSLDTVYYITAYWKTINSYGYASNIKTFKTESATSGTGETNKITLKAISSTTKSINLDVNIVGYNGKILRSGIAKSSSLIVDPTGSVDTLGYDYKEPNEQFTTYFPITKNFSINFNKLSAGSYYFAAYYQTSEGWTWSNVIGYSTSGEISSFSFTSNSPVVDDYSFTLSSIVSDESKVIKAGYQWSIDEINWNTVELSSWKSGPINFTFSTDVIDTYYIKAFVKLDDGSIYTSSIYTFEVTKEKPYSNFNPPSNASIGDFYTHKFNGVSRKWKKSEEGWQRVIDETVIGNITRISSENSTQSRVMPKISTVSEKLLDIVPNYHEYAIIEWVVDEGIWSAKIKILEDLRWNTTNIDWVLTSQNYSAVVPYDRIVQIEPRIYSINLYDGPTFDQVLFDQIEILYNLVDNGYGLKISRNNIDDNFIVKFKNSADIEDSSIIVSNGLTLDFILNNQVITNFTDPNRSPDIIGQRWVNLVSQDTWTAIGTSNVSDWISDGIKNQKLEYECILSQTGTNNPVATEISNKIDTINPAQWTRVNAGEYNCSFLSRSGYTDPVNWAIVQEYQLLKDNVYIERYTEDSSGINIRVIDASTGNPIDGKLPGIYFKLIIY